MEIFGIPSRPCFGQLLVGLINGSFYAILSLGLAVIFGLLNIINFAHGAQYMMGAFGAWLLLNKLGVNYWVALLLAPLVVGLFGVVIERTMLRKLYKLDHLYGLLLTFGLALIIEGLFRDQFGISGQPYPSPSSCRAAEPGLHVPAQLPRLGHRRLAVVCLGDLVRDRDAPSWAPTCAPATENPQLVQAFGINVPLHDHADLRLRRRRWRLRRRAGRADLPGQPADGLRT
jgi:branched-chain amino acid transport system permease protein